MTNLHSNDSRKTLDPNRHPISQASEPQDSSEPFTLAEPTQTVVPDQELEPIVIADQTQLQKADQSIEPATSIVISPSAPAVKKRRFTPKQVIIALGVTTALLGSAIAAMTFRTEQYNKIAEAERLLSETCHTATLSDADALNTAETGWNNAMARIQGVPRVPGFGAAEVQSLQTKYAGCKTNIEATKLFQEAATRSQPARSAVQRSLVLSEEEWENHLSQLDTAIEHLNLIPKTFDNSNQLKQSLPVFNAAQQRLKEYKQIRADAQKRHDREHNAVINFTAAKELYQQFEANQNVTDAKKRENVEVTLRNAIDRLRKIPPEGTTVSTEAVQLRQTYAQSLKTFEAEPAKQQLRQLAASFDRLSSDLEARISAQEFAASLNNIETRLNQLQQTAISRHPALRYFQSALEDYRFAQSLFNVCNQQPDNCFNGMNSDKYLSVTSPLFRALVDLYQVKSVSAFESVLRRRRGIRLSSATEKTAMKAVLEAADSKVKTAERLIKES
ncbi:hypothetical protein H6F89_18245 [Cyanobacteria bacterium FACHB-63]|nr:hypothetical protein [Cyanobacteria bacterium FACHB-63]